MTRIDKGWKASVLVAGVIACFATVDSAQAQRERSSGGASRQSAQAGQQRSGMAKAVAPASGSRSTGKVSNTQADSRSKNVRNTSVNNVNNVNVNVNVDRNVNVQADNGGCCNNGWDNDHPVATAAAIGATIAVTLAVIGFIVNAPPSGCVPVNHGGIVYQQCGTTWYQPKGPQYVVVAPPY